MCGRFKRGSDKQRVAKVFKVTAGLDETVFDNGDDLRPQSMQPVIYTNDAGERQMELMRWAFKLPDRLLFNARSEGIERSKFWKDAFLTGRCILPGDAIYEWVRPEVVPMIVRRGHATGPAVPSAVPQEVRRAGDGPLRSPPTMYPQPQGC